MIEWFYTAAALYCLLFVYFSFRNGAATTLARSVHSITVFVLACIFAVLSASRLPETGIFSSIAAVVGVAGLGLHVANNVLWDRRLSPYDRV